MWDRRKPEPVAANLPVQTQPPPVHSAPVLQGTSIGKAVSIIGDIYSEEDLYLDGEIKGRLEIKDRSLTIGPNGKATSDVTAREVIIQGQVRGDVEATQKITIRKAGSLVGNIKTSGIVIDDDAYFKGNIDIVRREPEAA